MANLPMVEWRTKTMVLLLLILIYQSKIVKSEVTIEEDQTGLVSVSGDCSQYGIDNLPHPRFILLGPTGVGKSTLANQLLGRNPYNKTEQVFSVGHDVDSHTIEITYVVGNWLGDGPCFTIIDTPGASDSEGRDYEHALAMANIMKDQIKSVDIFLLCFNGGVSRFDQATIDLLKLYESIFSKELWNHAVTEVTYWSHDKSSVRKRRRNKGMNEMKRHKQWNSQYKQELGVTVDIPSVYIDPVLPIFDAEEKEYLEEREIEAFEKYTDALWEAGNNTDPFICDGNCKAPNGYFLGNPWIKTNNINERQGEKAVIKCQIWNGIQGQASENVIWTHNEEIIYEKTTSKNPTETTINSTDVWGSNVKFIEMLSPGEGHYTDFIIEFESLEETMEGNYTCENERIAEDNWAEVFMRVDGTWGEWGKCSVSCLSKDGQMGYKRRVREAVSPRNGGNPVNPLDAKDTQICAGEQGPDNPIQCPIDFSWNSWTNWSECSPRCGEGTQYRMRFCNQGSHGGEMCPLSLGNNLSQKQEKECKIKDCPDCILLGWQEWSGCSKTCMGFQSEAGARARQRITEEADPNNPKCNPDDHSQREICSAFPCPVDGRWTPWSSYGPCSATCGSPSPTKMRTRSCTEPAAAYGGNPCTGPREDSENCNTKPCPVNGKWESWSPWSDCSATCGSPSPTQFRTRNCTTPQYGGERCPGWDKDSRSCNAIHCPVDGGWTPWSSYGTCSATCGSPSPTKIRRRSCTEPTAQYGGKSCSGLREEPKNCNTKHCPVDGQWASWSPWGDCSAPCGSLSPTQSRKRSCTDPSPQHEGKRCPGWDTQSTNCNSIPCPVDGGWTAWSPWSGCSATCSNIGSPKKSRTRSCTQPTAKYGGKPCSGNPHDSSNCNNIKCYYDETGEIYLDGGYWGTWGSKETCNFPHFVTGMNLNVESTQGGDDDTALNAVQLTCSDGGKISSYQRHYGSWRGRSSCTGGNYIRHAEIRRERMQGDGDDTSANGIRFWCTNGEIHYPHNGYWGQWQSMKSCKAGSAVMGIKTQAESHQGDDDDTALNDVILYCAKLIN